MIPAKTETRRQHNMVFTTAIEGGIDYWAQVNAYRWSAKTDDPNAFEGITEAADFWADIQEYDEPGPEGHFIINAKVIRDGIAKAYAFLAANPNVCDSYQRQAIRDLKNGAWDDVDYDATTADIIVQFGLLGELVYG